MYKSRVPAAEEESQWAPDDLEAVRRSAARWRWVLALTVLVMTTLVWAAWLEISTHEKGQALHAAARRQANLVVAVGQYLTRAFGNARAVSDYLAGVHALPAADFAAQLASRGRANELFTEMTVCNGDGPRATTGGPALADERAQWCARWLREAPPEAMAVPAAPVSAAGATFVPVLTRLPVTADRPGALLALLVDVRSLLGLMQEYIVPDETVIVVAGEDGRALARWHSATRMTDQRAPEAALLASLLAEPLPGQLRELQGRSLLATARRVGNPPLAVLIASSVPDTLAEANQRAAWFAAACTLATLLLVTFAALMLRLQNQAVRSAASLGRARTRLQALNAQLEVEVRERTRELEAAYRDLEAFSYTVAHDVRAPIAAIQGFAGALKPAVDGLGDPRPAHYLQRIEANATQMQELTESLLALGQLTRTPPPMTRVDLTAKAHDVLAGLRERDGTDRAVEFHVEDGLFVQGDRVLLRQVMENLLGNAWKFSVARDPAVIRVERVHDDEEGWTTVAIRDNGEGFDAASATELFKPFRRMHDAGAFPGTGVGLATVERIVRLHGGRTWVESQPAQGTSVYFRLRSA